MSEPTVPPSGPGQGPDPAVLENLGARVERCLGRLVEDTTAAQVFGPPVQVGERTVITASVVQRAGGFGFGAGSGSDPREGGGAGGGAGGGGSSEGRPVAVIDVGPEGVTVRPVLDLTRIGLTALTGLLAVWRFGRRPGGHRGGPGRRRHGGPGRRRSARPGV